jgi:hypothetical protein
LAAGAAGEGGVTDIVAESYWMQLIPILRAKLHNDNKLLMLSLPRRVRWFAIKYRRR